MPLKPIVAVVLVVSGSMAARGDDSRDDAIEGIWRPSAAELAGKKLPDEVRESIKLEVKGDDYNVTVGKNPDRGTCKLDPKAKPKTLDVKGSDGPNKDKTILAIHERKGDTLKVCYDLGGKARPAEFKTTAENRLFLVEYKLEKE